MIQTRTIHLLTLILCFVGLSLASACSDDSETPDGDVADGDGMADGDQTSDGDGIEDGDGDPDGAQVWTGCGYPDGDMDINHQFDWGSWGTAGSPISVEAQYGRYPFGEDSDWLTNPMSSWYESAWEFPEIAEPEDASTQGYYGVGNGTVFGLVGAWSPRNTVHGMLGPDYNKRGQGFFPDFRATVRFDGEARGWTSDQIWRPLKTQIVATRMALADSTVSLRTLTFSPPPESDEPLKRVIVQVLALINTAHPDTNEYNEQTVSLRVQGYADAQTLGDAAPYIEMVRDDHKLRVAPADAAKWQVVEQGENDWPALETKPIALNAGDIVLYTMVYEFTTDTGAPGDGLAAVQSAGWKPLLEQTRDWWHDWHAAGLEIETSDDRVDDAISGLKGAIRLQIADTGALVPMSHYTATWMRDSYAPARTLLKFGYPDEAWDIMDYYFKAACADGSIGNSMDADLTFSGTPEQPDWYANLPFGGREKGEGPSHLPLSHALYWRYTGERGDDMAARWDYLMHALRGQGVTDEDGKAGLMYFSGDETFRPQLSANLGLPGGANYKFEDLCYSANTAFLFVAAAEQLLAYANEYGLEASDDLQWLETQAQAIRNATEQFYWSDQNQRYSPFIYMDSMQAEPSPAEDVNTQPLWLGYLTPDNDRALDNILSSFEAIGQDNHLLQIVPPEPVNFLGYEVGDGLMTGMAPAYFLYNVATLRLPWADETFDSVGQYLSNSGNAYEVGIFSQPGKPFCPLYFRNGTEGELYARFRPWEGAIVAEAVAHFLVGFEADIPNGTMTIAPRIPHDMPRRRLCDSGAQWGLDYRAADGVRRHSYPHVNANGLPFGDARIDMHFQHSYEYGYEFTLTVRGGKTFADIGVTELAVRLYAYAEQEFVFDVIEPEYLSPEVEVLDGDAREVVFAVTDPESDTITLKFGVRR